MAKFQKGKSGNPTGRPKSDPAKLDLLAEIRRQLVTSGENGKTVAEQIVAALLDECIDGNVRAIQEVMNRVIGPVVPIGHGPAIDLESVARRMQEIYPVDTGPTREKPP